MYTSVRLSQQHWFKLNIFWKYVHLAPKQSFWKSTISGWVDKSCYNSIGCFTQHRPGSNYVLTISFPSCCLTTYPTSNSKAFVWWEFLGLCCVCLLWPSVGKPTKLATVYKMPYFMLFTKKNLITDQSINTTLKNEKHFSKKSGWARSRHLVFVDAGPVALTRILLLFIVALDYRTSTSYRPGWW